ncbi:hypothetical protein AMTRI_Chr04g246210 [Amborella trichopoda]
MYSLSFRSLCKFSLLPLCLCMLSARSVSMAKFSTYSLSFHCIFSRLRRPADLVPCCYHLSLLLKPLGTQSSLPFKNISEYDHLIYLNILTDAYVLCLELEISGVNVS